MMNFWTHFRLLRNIKKEKKRLTKILARLKLYGWSANNEQDVEASIKRLRESAALYVESIGVSQNAGYFKLADGYSDLRKLILQIINEIENQWSRHH